ncbi:MAG: hypothetical protein VST68_00270 [Nitrospirota bacterium]|nr:hypothetical protein [Nitrospirota bacterium]
MNDQQSTGGSSPAAISTTNNIIGKLPPKALVALIGISLLLLSFVIGWALYQNKPVSLWILNFGSSSDELHARIQELERQLLEKTSLVQVPQQQPDLGITLTAADLPGIIHPNQSKQAMIDHIQFIGSQAAALKEIKNDPYFVFLQLDKSIAQYRGSINTNKKDESRTEVYRLIQLSLQSVGFYDGDINGDQQTTGQVLQSFQQTYNNKAPPDQQISHVGFFGRLTLSAIRAKFIEINNST